MIVHGRPPNRADRVWTEAAEDVSIKGSLDRIESHAKYLFGLVSVVGVLLTAGSVVTPAVLASLQVKWLLLPFGFLCLSLVLAMYVLTPRTGEVDVENLESVRDYYTRLLRHRGRIVFAAGMAFAASLLAAVLVFPLLRGQEVSGAQNLRMLPAKEGAVLAATVDLTGLPDAAVAESRLSGLEEGGRWRTLATDVVRAGAPGKLHLEIAFESAAVYRRLALRTTVKARNRTIYAEEIQLAP